MKLHTTVPLLVLVLVMGSLSPPRALASEMAEAPGDTAGVDVCLDCHAAEELNLTNVHMRIRTFEVQGHDVGCEGCHGQAMKHAEEGDPDLIVSLSAEDDAADAVCMECHRTKLLTEWDASTHAAEGVGCLSCHSIHQEVGQAETCQGCHADEVAKFWLPSHHPVREGKMGCESCHDPHSATEALLKTRQRTNDVCYTCHQAQEGPFVFEHAPVEEDCGICHDPHGSVANNMLTVGEPMLCLQCHDFHFHAGYDPNDDNPVDVGGIDRENAFGAQGFNIAFTTNCTQCHFTIHGSDLPSQTTPGQGKGLLR